MSDFISNQKETIGDSLVLIVDDDPINALVIEQLVTEFYRTHSVSSGEAALEYCSNTIPDIILLDVMMEGMSGLDVCKLLKKNACTKHIPVVFITSILDQNSENSCWDAGCVDFVSKPVNGITLLNRIKSHLTLKFQADLLRRMTFLDGLTGLYNRHVLEQITDKGILHAKRSGHPLSIFMIDVDWFKKYNDHYGHLAGDECLRQVADALKSVFRRPADVCIRFGGEEFLCFLPETDHQGAKYLSQALMDTIDKLSIEHKDSPFGTVTVSVGCVTVMPSQSIVELNIVEAADAALYRAKASGRNQVAFSNV